MTTPKVPAPKAPATKAPTPPTIKVPTNLLTEPRLTASAKILWLWLLLQPDPSSLSIPWLASRSGLTRRTIQTGLAQLAATGWLTPKDCGPAHTLLPTALLRDHRIHPSARLLYAVLQLTPGFQHPAGQFTHPTLSPLANAGPNTVKRALQALRATGWLQTEQHNRFSPIHFTLRDPIAEAQQRAVLMARMRLEDAAFKGEALMREYLSLLIDSDEFDDNASPGYLVNPYTEEELQFDRYYPPSVAFEFQGPQHYGPTERYPNEIKARKQQGRDYIKLGICTARGINLILIHPEDLSADAIRQKVDGLLPLRDLHDHQPLLHYLDGVSRAYRAKARKTQAI